MFKYLQLVSLIGCTTFIFPNPCLAQFRPDRPTFFDDGQRLMDQEIQRLQQQQTISEPNLKPVEHPSQLLTIDDGQLRWQKYLFRDGGFSVWMPQGIQSNEIISLETKEGNIDFEMFATQPKSLRFIAAYSESKNLSSLGSNQEVLQLVKNSLIAKTNFELNQEKSISFESSPGILLEMKNDRETIYFQIYLINQTVYVLAVSTKSDNYKEDITGFFDSFRIIK